MKSCLDFPAVSYKVHDFRDMVIGLSLPVHVIGNLSQDELSEPILDVVLEPGDLLYFPRGTVHQV